MSNKTTIGDQFKSSLFLSNGRGTNQMVPDSAILIQGDNRYVYVETSSGSFEKRSVKTGISVGGKTEIAKGVSAGEKVVTRGDLLLEGEE